MKKLFNGWSAGCILALAASFSFVSCVNEEYDLSQGIDTNMTLLQNTTIPLGKVAPIPLSSLLGDLEGSDSTPLKVDEQGNISLSFGNDRITQSFTMPEVEIGGEGGLKFDDNVEVKFIPKYKGINLGGMHIGNTPPSSIPNEIHFSQSEGGILERSFDIDLHKELPEQIVDIDEVHLESTLLYRFKVSEGTILHISEGFSLTFPDFMVILKGDGSENYKIDEKDPNTIVFTEDTRISENEPFELVISFTRMDIPEGVIESVEDPENKTVKRFINIADASVDVAGDLYLLLTDYIGGVIPECAILTMDIEIDNLRMKSAHVKLDLDIAIEDKTVEIGELPEIFTSEGTVVDLYNPVLRFWMDNGSPFNMFLNANITAYSKTHQTDIHIGDCTPYFDGDEHEEHSTEPLIILAEDEVEYFFSRRGMHDGHEDIMLDKIGDIMKEMPEKITIHDILVDTDDRFVNIEADKEFSVEMEYEFISPLAFGEDLRISLNYDIDLGINGESALGLDSLIVGMDMINTIPLNFAVTGVVLDADGNEIKDADVDLKLNLAAGTLENPAKSPVEMTIVLSSVSSVEKLRLQFIATSSEAMAGKSLNTEQGLGIEKLTITLPQGITLDLNYDENNEN